MSSLHSLCQVDDPASVANCLKSQTPNIVDSDGFYPIHYTSLFGFDNSMRLLINANASIDVVTTNGSTPLHLAVKCGRLTTHVKRGYLPIAEYIVMKFPELATGGFEMCVKNKFTNLMKMLVDYVPSKDIIKIISTTNFKSWAPAPTNIVMEVDKEFEYKIDISPYDEKYCDYFINSIPAMEQPLHLHSAILKCQIPYFTLISTQSTIQLQPKSLILLCQYCYSQNVDSIYSLNEPIEVALDILGLAHPNRLGDIVDVLIDSIQTLIQKDFKELQLLRQFFENQQHRILYEKLFKIFLYVLLENTTVEEITVLWEGLSKPFLLDVLSFIESPFAETQLPNYKAIASTQ
ncbi:Hspc200 [Entamoeba marina]